MFTQEEIVEYRQSECSQKEDSQSSRMQKTEEHDSWDDYPVRVYLFYTLNTAEGWIDANSKADNWNDAVFVPRGVVFHEQFFARYRSTDDALVHLFERAAFDSPAPAQHAEARSTPASSSILVVRNLKKREYIRRDVAEAKAQEPPSPFADGSLFEVVASYCTRAMVKVHQPPYAIIPPLLIHYPTSCSHKANRARKCKT